MTYISDTNQEFLNTPITELELYGLRLRWINMLENRMGVRFVRDLEGVSEKDLLGLSSFGKCAVLSLRNALAELLKVTVKSEKGEQK